MVAQEQLNIKKITKIIDKANIDYKSRLCGEKVEQRQRPKVS